MLRVPIAQDIVNCGPRKKRKRQKAVRSCPQGALVVRASLVVVT